MLEKKFSVTNQKKNTTKYENKSERENEPVELIIKKI
jgi:hypothetical protein